MAGEKSPAEGSFISKFTKTPLFKSKIKINLSSLWFWDYVLQAIKKKDFGLRKNSDLITVTQ